jgi:nitrogen regulatory protein PII
MESNSSLITFILNRGDAHEVMMAARAAGAKGGTILDARGTSVRSDVKFFGLSLAQEKEMLVIVVDKDIEKKILDAVKELPAFKKPASNIVYTTDVNRVALASL